MGDEESLEQKDPKEPKQPKKPGFWSKLGQAFGNAVGQAKFGQ